MLKGYDDDSFDTIIEPDIGIYHAMNKAIIASDSEWLLFMNAGDRFHSKSSLSSAMRIANNNVDVVYADWYYQKSKIRNL